MTTTAKYTHQCDVCDMAVESKHHGYPRTWQLWDLSKVPGYNQRFAVCEECGADSTRGLFRKLFRCLKARREGKL